MNTKLVLTIICFTTILTLSSSSHESKAVDKFETIGLNGATGPESLDFVLNGDGLYTGVEDGRVLKLTRNGSALTSTEIAVTDQNRKNGRPLGLRVDEKTGEVYIADANLGLLVVGPRGGLATKLADEAEGQKLIFSNDLDIDSRRQAVYFSQSSSKFRRGNFSKILETKDRTGKLISYNIKTKEVKVLLKDLFIANGVSLSKDGTFVLVSESGENRVLRYWLEGPKTGKSDVFAKLAGRPDNIRRNSNGEFWVALTSTVSGETPHAIAVKISEKGKVVKVLEDKEGLWSSISQVSEKNGKLWMGSVARSNITVHDL